MKAAAYMSLAELAAEVQEALDADFGGRRIRVLAETCDVKVYWNRTYAFLDLIEKKDGQLVAKMGAVVWSRDFGIIQKFKKLTGQSFEENLELLLEVELQFNPRYGLRLSIISIDENYTLGKLQAEKDQTLEKLLLAAPKHVWRDGEELRSANQVLSPGPVMQRIVLLAAAGSDGRQDFLHELEQNPYSLDFSVLDIPVQVQGEQATRQIAAAFAKINKSRNLCDAVCLVRGGGSNSDLSAFDSYEVVLGLVKCPYPVITGIGHERNVSLADRLAWKAAKTPTKTAASLVDHNAEFLGRVQHMESSLGIAAQRLLRNQYQKLEHTEIRMGKAANWRIAREKQQLELMQHRLGLLDPQRSLERGFALVRVNGTLVKTVSALHAGSRVQIQLQDGSRDAVIQ